MTKTVVKTCPFCGGVPIIEPWHGGGPKKRMISCEAEDCDVNPSVTGETPKEAADRWNVRDTQVRLYTINDKNERAA